MSTTLAVIEHDIVNILTQTMPFNEKSSEAKKRVAAERDAEYEAAMKTAGA